jgi:hypothetical protein
MHLRRSAIARFAALAVTLFASSLRAQSTAPGTPTTSPIVVAPMIAPIAPVRAQIGDSVRIPLIVNDLPLGTVVEFRLDRAPGAARVENGILRWRPLRSDANATYPIGIRALSGGVEIARGAVEITVADAHRPPIIRQPADRVIPPGDSLTVPIEATDPDGDVLTYAVTNVTDPALPPRLDRQTGTLAWQAPRTFVNRVYLWRVTASDGDGGTTSTEFHVSVRSQNVAPVCAPMRTYKRDEGEAVEIALDAEDANGDSLSYQPLATLPNGALKGASYQWSIPYGFVLPTRQDSTVRFEWKATDPSGASTSANCFALVTVFRSMAEGPFRARQQQHRQLIADVRSELANYTIRERATRDSLAAATGKKRTVKQAALLSALVGGLLQIAKSEDTRRIAAGVSASVTVGLSGWESTIEDGGPLANRAELLAQQRATLQRALARFLRKYGETVSRESLLGASYEADHLELFDLLAATGRAGSATSPLTEPAQATAAPLSSH